MISENFEDFSGLLLITNYPIDETTIAQFVYQLYLQRSKMHFY